MLGYLLEAPHSDKSCGSVPVNYPLLNDSYNEFTVNYVYGIPCIGYCSNNQDSQGRLPNNDRGYAPGTCKVSFLQYQSSIDASMAATTNMDVSILDANGLLIGGTWYQESLPSQTWDLPSQLPAMLLVGLGAVQSDAITFAYNGGEFDTSSSHCVLPPEISTMVSARGAAVFPAKKGTIIVSVDKQKPEGSYVY